MKYLLLATSLIASAAIAPITYADPAYATPNESQATTYVKDSTITAKIKTKLAEDKLTSATRLKVDTDNAGAVILSGHAASDDEAARAVAIAQATDGVTSVKNEIIVSRQQ